MLRQRRLRSQSSIRGSLGVERQCATRLLKRDCQILSFLRPLHMADVCQLCREACLRVKVIDLAGECLGYGTAFFFSEMSFAITSTYVLFGEDYPEDVKYVVADYHGNEYTVTEEPYYDAFFDIAVLKTPWSPTSYLKGVTAHAGQSCYKLGFCASGKFISSKGVVSAYFPAGELAADMAVVAANPDSDPGYSGGPCVTPEGFMLGITSGVVGFDHTVTSMTPIFLLSSLLLAHDLPSLTRAK